MRTKLSIAMPVRVSFLVLMLGGISALGDCVAPPSGLVAWWRGEGNAQDAVGFSHGSLLNGVSFVTGRIGQAFKFNSSSGSYISVPDSQLWDLSTNDFTIELWANFASVAENHNLSQPWAIFIGNDDAGGQFRNKWFFAESDGTLTFHINGQNVPGGGGLWLARTPFTPETNRWYHLVVTRQGAVFTTWIDGVAGATSTDSTVIPNSVAPLTIGQAEGLGYLNGQLDEVSLYRRALSAAEIQSIVSAGTAGKCLSIAPPPAPILQIARQPTDPGTVLLLWPGDATGFGVESKTNILQAGWDASSTPVGRTNGFFFITDAIMPAQKIYRLHQP
jgi:hypothetical protein